MSELRKKIVARIEAGDKPMNIAKSFGVARSTVYNVYKLYKDTGDYAKQSGNAGRPRSVRKEETVDKVKKIVEENPNTSVRQLARDLNVSKTTMGNLVRSDLGMRNRAVVPCQMLTTAQREKRLERCQRILNFLKSNGGKVIVFSDEKNFLVDKYLNRRKSRYIAKRPEDVHESVRFIPRSKHPAKVMMLGVVCSDGYLLPPIWINGNLDSKMYKYILIHKIIPVLNSRYGEGNFVWTQDGAPSHTSDTVQKYLVSKLLSLIHI